MTGAAYVVALASIRGRPLRCASLPRLAMTTIDGEAANSPRNNASDAPGGPIVASSYLTSSVASSDTIRRVRSRRGSSKW
jgi:hypothetical protein